MSFWEWIARGWRMRPGRAALSIASVAIAVAAVLGTALAQSSVRLGVRRLTQEIDKHPAIEIVAYDGGRFAADDIPKVTDIPGVTAAVPIVSRATMGRVGGKRFRTVLVGLPVDEEIAWQSLSLAKGRACRESGEAVLAAEVARNLGADVGDRLIVITRRGPRSATIVGLATASTLAALAPAASLAMPLDGVQEYFGLSGRVDRVRLPILATERRERILAAVAARLPTDLAVQVPASPSETIDTTLRSTELALRLAGAMSMAMAAFIILNTLRLNFSERRREVAVVRVLGATRGQLLGAQLGEGLALGGLGTAIGVPLGIGLGRALEQTMSRMMGVDVSAAEVPWASLAAVAALGPIVAGAAALVPALQARKVSPVEAMGEIELRRGERFPLWAAAAGVIAWCVAVALVSAVASERLAPEAAIPAGLLMLVAFIAVIPVVVGPIVRTGAWALSPWLRTEGQLASEQLLARATRSGLTIGVLVVALSAGLGLGTAIVNNVDDVRGWYRRSLAGDVFLTNPAAADQAVDDSRDVGATVAASEGVERVVEIRLLSTRANGLSATCIVRDFAPEVELPWVLASKDEARLRSQLEAGDVAISRVLARQLDVAAGDTVRLEVQGRAFARPVAALVNDYMLGGRVVYIDQQAAAELISLGPPSFMIVEAAPGVATDQLASQLEIALADEGIAVQSFAEMRRQLDGLIGGVVAALWGLLAIGFLVGGVAVGNTLKLNVLEQTRELGLLRMIGMTPRQVRKLVLCESLFLGGAGSLLGTAGGVTTALVIHLCNEPVLGRAVQFNMPAWLLAANAGGCLAIALVAAWQPGRAAAQLDVLLAISYE